MYYIVIHWYLTFNFFKSIRKINDFKMEAVSELYIAYYSTNCKIHGHFWKSVYIMLLLLYVFNLEMQNIRLTIVFHKSSTFSIKIVFKY